MNERAPMPVIRDLVEADLDWVAERETEIFGPAAWSRATIGDDFASGLRRYRAVDVAGSLVAYAVYGADADAAHLMNLAVVPDRRQEGWGHALMDDFLAWARTTGSVEASLEVAATNAAAEHLYRTHGFDVVRIRRRYYQPEDVDALVMRAAVDVGAGTDATPALEERP